MIPPRRYFAERLTPFICGSRDVKVWTFDHNGGGNSIVAHSSVNNATFILIDNDEKYMQNFSMGTINFMRDIRFVPDVLVLGVTNEGTYKRIQAISPEEHHQIKIARYRDAFPRASVVSFATDSVGRLDCSAENAPHPGNCSNCSVPGDLEEPACRAIDKKTDKFVHPWGRTGHQCFPGPIVRVAEETMLRILKALGTRWGLGVSSPGQKG